LPWAFNDDDSSTVKHTFYTCPLFHELCDVAKITGREYLKSHAILVYYLVQQAKNAKIKGAKIM